jgi:putative membrane protein
MDGFWNHMTYWDPYGWMILGMVVVWIVQLVIGYLVYRDAREHQINAVLWFVLVILPMIGFLFLAIYIVIRETRHPERYNNEVSPADPG